MAKLNQSAGLASAFSLTAERATGTSPEVRAKRVGILLSEIASLAAVFVDLGASIVEDAFDDANRVTLHGVCVRELAGKVGWAADLALSLHDSGEILFRGVDGARWMLPYSYCEVGKSADVTSLEIDAPSDTEVDTAIDEAQGGMLAFGMPIDVAGDLHGHLERIAASGDPSLRRAVVAISWVLAKLDQPQRKAAR